jgi:hypothetical protein
MGKWAMADDKGKFISADGPSDPPLTEVEKELYKFIKVLEEQIERLDKQIGPEQRDV